MIIDDEELDYFTLRVPGRSIEESGVDVLGWGTYPESSVLAGQPRKVFLCNLGTEQAAREWLALELSKHGQMPLDHATKIATEVNFSNRWTEPQVSLAHLPSEDDPVAGGMYPDDY